MKRHMDLITKILRYAEVDCTGNALEVSNVFDGYTARQVHEHLKLCEEAGFLTLERSADCQDQYGSFPVYKIVRLTWNGHEFLDANKRTANPKLRGPGLYASN